MQLINGKTVGSIVHKFKVNYLGGAEKAAINDCNQISEKAGSEKSLSEA